MYRWKNYCFLLLKHLSYCVELWRALWVLTINLLKLFPNSIIYSSEVHRTYFKELKWLQQIGVEWAQYKDQGNLCETWRLHSLSSLGSRLGVTGRRWGITWNSAEIKGKSKQPATIARKECRRQETPTKFTSHYLSYSWAQQQPHGLWVTKDSIMSDLPSRTRTQQRNEIPCVLTAEPWASVT